jgi:hypothetical protein
LPFYIPDNIKIFGNGSVTSGDVVTALTRPLDSSVSDGMAVALPYTPDVIEIPVTSVFATPKAELAYAAAELAVANAELAYAAAEFAVALGKTPLASLAVVIVPSATSAAIMVPSVIESAVILLSAIYLFSIICSIYYSDIQLDPL